jgi:hypothetical protein
MEKFLLSQRKARESLAQDIHKQISKFTEPLRRLNWTLEDADQLVVLVAGNSEAFANLRFVDARDEDFLGQLVQKKFKLVQNINVQHFDAMWGKFMEGRKTKWTVETVANLNLCRSAKIEDLGNLEYFDLDSGGMEALVKLVGPCVRTSETIMI